MYTSIEEPKISKYYKLVYIGISGCLIILTIVDLALKTWFRYCWWSFGLVFAESFTSFKILNNENSISDVKSDACGSLKELVEDNCPNFCNYIDGFESAGAVMIFFGVLYLIIQSCCLFFHVLVYFKSGFKFKIIWVFLILPTLTYLLGFLVYIGIAELTSLDSVDHQRFGAENYQMKEGIILSIVLVNINFLQTVFGFLKTRKAFY